MPIRTDLARRHALIAAEGHVPSALPGWEKATGSVRLSLAVGASLWRTLSTWREDGGSALCAAEQKGQTFFLERGTCRIHQGDGEAIAWRAGGFAFIPGGNVGQVSGTRDARVTVFDQEFEPLAGVDPPPATCDHGNEVEGDPFLGNQRAIFQTLLPSDPRFDLAINISPISRGMRSGWRPTLRRGLRPLGTSRHPSIRRKINTG